MGRRSKYRSNCVDPHHIYKKNLLNMPSVVIREILNYLEFNDLKNLRLVCQCIKYWIEQPFYLQKLPIYVKDEDRLIQVANSAVKWNNLVFPLVVFPSNGSAKLLQQLRPFLKSVTVGIKGKYCLYSWTSNLIDHYLCHLGPELESLNLYGNFHLTAVLDGCKDIMETDRRKLMSLKFPGLRNLEFVPPKSIKADWLWTFLEALLRCSPNLNCIKFPIMSSHYMSFKYKQENPFIPYLKNLGRKAGSERPSKFLIDFSSDWDCIESIHGEKMYYLEPVFPLNTSTLIELATLCVPIGGKLMNVPITSLPTYKEADTLTKCQLQCLNHSLKSVLCKNISTGVGKIYIPFTTSVRVTCDFEEDEDLSEFQLPEHTNVTHISMSSPSTWGLGDDMFLSTLLDVVRPSVKEIRLNCELSFSSKTFPNLQRLFVYGVWENDFFSNLFKNLSSNLKELYMEKCSMNQDCFFDVGVRTRLKRPVLYKLKKLAHVRIINCHIIPDKGLPSIDVKPAFKLMNLKTFIYSCC